MGHLGTYVKAQLVDSFSCTKQQIYIPATSFHISFSFFFVLVLQVLGGKKIRVAIKSLFTNLEKGKDKTTEAFQKLQLWSHVLTKTCKLQHHFGHYLFWLPDPFSF